MCVLVFSGFILYGTLSGLPDLCSYFLPMLEKVLTVDSQVYFHTLSLFCLSSSTTRDLVSFPATPHSLLFLTQYEHLHVLLPHCSSRVAYNFCILLFHSSSF